MPKRSDIRKAAIQQKIPYITTLAAAAATVEGIEAIKAKKETVKPLQEYLQDGSGAKPITRTPRGVAG